MLVMDVVAEDVVHAGVSGDVTGMEEGDEEETDTVEAVDVGMCAWVPFLQEDGPDRGVVAAVEPMDIEDEGADEEDIDNRNTVIHQYFQ
ncbi:hypothetical protein NDU88_001995 [Pleurodeles waltl]|uniref:Uncharacterized protein n=1 Tax=Pleurodeles waltl TaxID=8319 RepID=A0AAV7VB90_PLEWA|nr:hypothetical protein NDU88_001995 [Pleurodeles waltl]